MGEDISMEDAALIASFLSNESMQYGNYNSNNSPLSYNADMGNYMDAGYYNSDMGTYDPTAARLGQQVSKNLSKFRFKMVWATGGAGTSEPVNIQLFQTAFNTGTFTPSGDLQFTNTGGNTATISRMSANAPTVKQFFQLLGNNTLGIAWARITARDFAQLQNPMTIWERSQFTSGSYNEIVPDDYYRPTYYDKLTVEMSMSIIGSEMQGFDWILNPTETGSGTIIVFNVDSAVNIAKLHSGQAPVRKLGPPQTFFQNNEPVGIPAMSAVKAYLAVKNAKPPVKIPPMQNR